jgi:hypothetical protein
MGGIVVDGNGAVLDRNDTPLPGLFAAGSTVGGLDGGPNAGYVGGLIKATIALRAAEAIAAASSIFRRKPAPDVIRNAPHCVHEFDGITIAVFTKPESAYREILEPVRMSCAVGAPRRLQSITSRRDVGS